MDSNILKPTKWKIILVLIVMISVAVLIFVLNFGYCLDCSPAPSDEERDLYENAVKTKDYKLCQKINPKTLSRGGIAGGSPLRGICLDDVFSNYIQEGDKLICKTVNLKDVEINKRLGVFCSY